MRVGSSVLLEDVGESLEPALDPILLKLTFMQGWWMSVWAWLGAGARGCGCCTANVETEMQCNCQETEMQCSCHQAQRYLHHRLCLQKMQHDLAFQNWHCVARVTFEACLGEINFD